MQNKLKVIPAKYLHPTLQHFLYFFLPFEIMTMQLIMLPYSQQAMSVFIAQ